MEEHNRSHYWVASYGGNPPNTNGAVNTCGEVIESSVIISLVPTVTTAQSFFPNDSATVTVVGGGGNLAGSVTFEMWIGSATCSGTADFQQTLTLSGTGALTKTVETTNYPGGVVTPLRLNAASQTIYWKVSYTSTNQSHQNVTGVCGDETSTLTINNNAIP